MTMLRREGKKKLETIAIVPQMLITPEMLLTDELCLGRNRGVGSIKPKIKVSFTALKVYLFFRFHTHHFNVFSNAR